MKPTEQYFPVVLFIMLFKVVLTFESVPGWNPSVRHFMKATEHYFAVVLFILVYKLLLAFEFVDEIVMLVNKLQVKTYVKTKQLRMDLSHPLPLRLVVL